MTRPFQNRRRSRSRSRNRSRSRPRYSTVPSWRPSVFRNQQQNGASLDAMEEPPLTQSEVREIMQDIVQGEQQTNNEQAVSTVTTFPTVDASAPPVFYRNLSEFQEPSSVGSVATSFASSSMLEPMSLSALESGRERSPFVMAARQLKFCCQLAHGSPTAIIADFDSVPQLFDAIAAAYNIERDEIIFCTLNTFKPDMEALFAGNVVLTDLLFVHLKGQKVEVELTKDDSALGITIADNGLCRCFLKRIRKDSIADKARPALTEGQLIETIDGQNVLGMRHYQVAKVLRNIPIGKTFKMRLVSPLTSDFCAIAPRGALARKKKTEINSSGTIRFKSSGGVVMEENAPDKVMIEKVNNVIDSYLGVNDDDLAQTIWDTVVECETLKQMGEAVEKSDLKMFDFPEEFLFDLWGIVTDYARQMESVSGQERSDRAAVPLSFQ